MMLPGTSIEVSQQGARKAYEQVQVRYGLCGGFALLFSAVLGIGLIVGIVVVSIATIVFAIQALVVGSQTLDDERYSGCRLIAQWMLVFGSFVFIGCFFSCCCENRNRDGESRPITIVGIVSRLFHLITFAWICYGMAIVGNPGTYPVCSPSQYSVFSLMVLFMFWGLMSLIIAAVLLVFCLAPILPSAQLGGHEKSKAEEELATDETDGLLA